MQKNRLPPLLPIRRFFQSLTKNNEIIELAVKIQQGLEQGHSCIPWDKHLEGNLISDNGEAGYIVINNNYAGFRRFYLQEKFIHNEFKNNALDEINSNDLARIIKQVKTISPEDTTENIDKQWQASLAFLWHKRFLLNGGPGTGKTTTVIRMLLIYKALYPNHKMALGAPTGKAANRLSQSIHNFRKANDILVNPAQTLHRLLAYNPQTNKLKYNQNNPLPYDLVTIDEASMLDISMTHALLKALKPSAKLVLIGDKDQLPAVEAGNVFADLCDLNKNTNTSLNLLHQIENHKQINPTEIHNSTELSKNYRFLQGSIVAQLSENLRNNDLKLFQQHKNNHGFIWDNPTTLEDKRNKLKQWYQTIVQEETSIILSATNFGDNSVDEMNRLAAEILHPNSHKCEGIPLMVTKNDYSLNLFNGDIGSMTNRNDKWYVAFIIDNEKQYIQLDAIAQKQMAHAISIHKSQGSEYDHVMIVIPDNLENELLTKQLLYTAMTRAKTSVSLWASEPVIKKIMATDANRTTFLKISQFIENN